MRIIIFGGSFDPPHLGHQLVAQTIIKQNLADEVWLMPCYDNPFTKKLSEVKHRLAMLNFLAEEKIKVSNYEIEQATISYSYYTLKYLAQTQPENQFTWVIGSDRLERFREWHRYEKLLEEFEVYVYPRKGFDLKPLLPGMKVIANVEEVGISSQEIKKRVAENLSIENLVPKKIEEYIMRNNLYKK